MSNSYYMHIKEGREKRKSKWWEKWRTSTKIKTH